MKSLLNFSLTQLEYVIAVYQHGHFAKAAQQCGVTQPTLSMQLHKFEDDIGVVLFDRSKKPILLTDAGKSIIEQIQNILFEAKKMESVIEQSSKGRLSGKLVLGVIPTVAPDLLHRLLPILDRASLGNLELQIREMQTDQIIEALNSDDLDVGLLATPLNLPKIHEFALYYEPFFVLCKKGHVLSRLKKVSASALSADDLWLLQEGHCLRHQMLDVCALKDRLVSKQSESEHGKRQSKLQEKLRYRFESGSLETLKNLVNSYGGYTLLPALSRDTVGSQSEIVPFDRPIPAREIGLVFRREHYKSELIEYLGKAILEAIPAEMRKLRKKDLEVIDVKAET